MMPIVAVIYHYGIIVGIKKNLVDQILKQIWKDDVITFAFHQRSHEAQRITI